MDWNSFWAIWASPLHLMIVASFLMGLEALRLLEKVASGIEKRGEEQEKYLDDILNAIGGIASDVSSIDCTRVLNPGGRP